MIKTKSHAMTDTTIMTPVQWLSDMTLAVEDANPKLVDVVAFADVDNMLTIGW